MPHRLINEKAALDWLYGTQLFGMKLGLERANYAVVDWYSSPSELTRLFAGKLTTTFAVDRSKL